MSDPDLLLWSRAKEDDQNAFEVLFKKYYPCLCFLSRRYTNDITTSREVVQDIFIHIWEHRKEIEITQSFKLYLSSAARYNSTRRVQRDKKANVNLDMIQEPDQEFYDHLEFAELQRTILIAIESLPEQCRKVFLMSRFDQLKYAEIALQLNLSIKTIEAHISKALRNIQVHLNK